MLALHPFCWSSGFCSCLIVYLRWLRRYSDIGVDTEEYTVKNRKTNCKGKEGTAASLYLRRVHAWLNVTSQKLVCVLKSTATCSVLMSIRDSVTCVPTCVLLPCNVSHKWTWWCLMQFTRKFTALWSLFSSCQSKTSLSKDSMLDAAKVTE